MQSKPIFRYKACREYFKYARLEFGNHFQHSSWQSPTFFQQKRNGKSLKAFTLWKINNWSGAGKEKKRKKKIAKYRKNDVNNRNIENLFPDLFCCSDLQPPGREDIHSKWRVHPGGRGCSACDLSTWWWLHCFFFCFFYMNAAGNGWGAAGNFQVAADLKHDAIYSKQQWRPEITDEKQRKPLCCPDRPHWAVSHW